MVSLGGLLATQLVALMALLFLRLPIEKRHYRQILGTIAFGFAYLDVIVQVIQGLLYDLSHKTWPTNIDLVDFMLLVQEKPGASQLLLKGLILAVTILYLFWFVWFNRQKRATQKV